MSELAASVPRVALLLEQTLGHVTHAANLRAELADSSRAQVEFADIDFAPRRRLDRLPLTSNWTVRAGAQARAAVKQLERSGGPLDALFVHTQVPAVMLGAAMTRIPTIVSIDATPKQIDSLGEHYAHGEGPAPIERAKLAANRRCFQRAASLVAWSQWAADGLVNEYGIDPAKIDVLHPGVRPATWRRSEARPDDSTVRVLFVGGDLHRKGGDLLIDAVRRLRTTPEIEAAGVELELHLATTADVASEPGIVVHRGLTPNSADLVALYHRCDVFALPTRGDCLPMVLGEAAVSELPLVSTDVGAIAEIVRDGETGHIVDPDVVSIEAALRRLALDRDHRRTLGTQAAAHAEAALDAGANAQKILDRLLDHADRNRTPRVSICVSGDVSPTIDTEIEAGERPLADYVAIARRCNADIIDRTLVASEANTVGAVLGRIHPDLAMAHHLFRERGRRSVVITDGEQVGYPLALMLRVGGRRGLRHVMIGHRLSVPKKKWPARVLGLHRAIDEVLLYSTRQVDLAVTEAKISADKIHLIDFMVDTEFFAPTATDPRPDRDRPLISTAGREGRDYPTLIEAVRGLDVDVLIASASPWSKRDDNAHDVDVPDNVEVTRLTQAELRDTMNDSAFVVVPVVETDFQAGVTTILEAMSMARAVVCTRTAGQTDVIEDGVTGRYVAPGDVEELRAAIQELLADPLTTARLGDAARGVAEQRMDVRVYADGFAAAVARQEARR